MFEFEESGEGRPDISSLLESRSDIKDSVTSILNIFQQCSESQVMQTLLQFLVDTMITPRKVDLADVDVRDFSQIAEKVNSCYVPTPLTGTKFQRFHKIMDELCKQASSSNRTFWYQEITDFLMELRKYKFLEPVAAKLSLSMLIALNDVRVQMTDETLPEQERISEMKNLDYIFNCCLKLFDVAAMGVRYKAITKSIGTELFRLIETCPDFYTKDAKCLKLYLECFCVVDLDSSLTALQSMQTILNDTNMNEGTRKIFIDIIVEKEFINTIRALICSAPVKIARNAFETVIRLHDYMTNIPSWEATDYVILYAKTFHKNASIRRAAAKLFLKLNSEQCKHDGEIFLKILEFYFKYQKNADMLDNYMDAFWEYPYLKSFSNILALIRLDGCSILAMPHVAIAVLKKMIKEVDLYKDKILVLLKKLPLIFEDLKDEVIPYGILLDIFHYVDLNLYNAIDQKYFSRLLTHLINNFQGDNYKLLGKIFYFLVRFNNNSELKQLMTNEYTEIIETTCDDFLEILSEWESRNFHVEDIDLNVLAGSVFRVSAVVRYSPYLDDQVEDQIISRLKPVLLAENQFLKLPEDNNLKNEIEAAAITLNADLLLRKAQKLLMSTDSNTIEMVNLANGLSDLMKVAISGIIREERTLFFEQHVFESLIRCILISNRSITNSASEEIRSINVELSKESYKIITNFVADVLQRKPEENNARSTLTMKRRILQAYTKLHTEYIDLPFSVIISNIVLYLAVNNEFKDELKNLIAAFLQYRPNEEKGSRFVKIFGAVLFILWKIEQHEKILKTYITIYRSKMSVTDYNELITGSILNMFDMVEKFITVVEPQPRVNENRLRSLKVLGPLLSTLNPKFLNKILENSKRLAPINPIKNETQTLRELRRSCS